MVTARKPAPRAVVAGDVVYAQLAELLVSAGVEISPAGPGAIVLAVCDHSGGRVRYYTDERLDRAIFRAATDAPPDSLEYR